MTALPKSHRDLRTCGDLRKIASTSDYSKLFEMDAKGCMAQMSDKITKNGQRGCNSEMLLKFFLEKEGARVSTVGQGLVPFQRSVNLLKPDGSRELCFHKFCQSEENTLLVRKRKKHKSIVI